MFISLGARSTIAALALWARYDVYVAMKARINLACFVITILWNRVVIMRLYFIFAISMRLCRWSRMDRVHRINWEHYTGEEGTTLERKRKKIKRTTDSITGRRHQTFCRERTWFLKTKDKEIWNTEAIHLSLIHILLCIYITVNNITWICVNLD